MVWAKITDTVKTPLTILDGNLNANCYINVSLIPVVVPDITNTGGYAVFQDDNAHPHQARMVREFMVQQQIQMMEWPACSPDLNPNEHLWDQIGKAVRRRINQHNTLPGLRRYLQEEWYALPQEWIRRLTNSMQQCCLACVNAQGGATHY